MLAMSGLVTMITVTLIYGSDLGWGTVAKFWAIFLVLGIGSALLFHSTMLSSILQVGTAVSLFSKAKFSSGALD